MNSVSRRIISFFTKVIYAGIMPPLKKRKIVSSQRSALWPCGSCRQNCKSGSICCDACKRWHHASCEGLNAADFKFFNESDATKAIDHVFPSATRYLCTKHLKDNVKHYLLNKVGTEKRERETLMNSLFGDGGIVDANCTVDFSSRSSDFEDMLKNKYPVFDNYYAKNLKPRLEKYVFEPTRKVEANKNWTNNNAESINNILKISIDWKPKHTDELIQKLYSVTELHFMDYLSAIHDSGNYEFVPAESSYRVPDAVWRCNVGGREEKHICKLPVRQ